MVKHTQFVGCHWQIVWLCTYNIYYIYIYILYIYQLWVPLYKCQIYINNSRGHIYIYIIIIIYIYIYYYIYIYISIKVKITENDTLWKNEMDEMEDSVFIETEDT